GARGRWRGPPEEGARGHVSRGVRLECPYDGEEAERDQRAKARRYEVHRALSDDPPPLQGRSEDAVDLTSQEANDRGDHDQEGTRGDWRRGPERREDVQHEPADEGCVRGGRKRTRLA